MERNRTGGVEIGHDEIEQILIDAVIAKYPELVRDKDACIRLSVYSEGMYADVTFSSFN